MRRWARRTLLVAGVGVMAALIAAACASSEETGRSPDDVARTTSAPTLTPPTSAPAPTTSTSTTFAGGSNADPDEPVPDDLTRLEFGRLELQAGAVGPAPDFPLAGASDGVILFRSANELLVLSPDGAIIRSSAAADIPRIWPVYEHATLVPALRSGSLHTVISLGTLGAIELAGDGPWAATDERRRFTVIEGEAGHEVVDFRTFETTSIDGLRSSMVRPAVAPSGEWIGGASSTRDGIWLARPQDPNGEGFGVALPSGSEVTAVTWPVDDLLRSTVEAGDLTFVVDLFVDALELRATEVPGPMIGRGTASLLPVVAAGPEFHIYSATDGTLVYEHAPERLSQPVATDHALAVADDDQWVVVHTDGSVSRTGLHVDEFTEASARGNTIYFDNPSGSATRLRFAMLHPTEGLVDFGELLPDMADDTFFRGVSYRAGVGDATFVLETVEGSKLVAVTEAGVRVLDVGGDERAPVFSPDGRRVALSTASLESERSRLLLIDLETGERTELGEFERGWVEAWIPAPSG